MVFFFPWSLDFEEQKLETCKCFCSPIPHKFSKTLSPVLGLLHKRKFMAQSQLSVDNIFLDFYYFQHFAEHIWGKGNGGLWLVGEALK